MFAQDHVLVNYGIGMVSYASRTSTNNGTTFYMKTLINNLQSNFPLLGFTEIRGAMLISDVIHGLDATLNDVWRHMTGGVLYIEG